MSQSLSKNMGAFNHQISSLSPYLLLKLYIQWINPDEFPGAIKKIKDTGSVAAYGSHCQSEPKALEGDYVLRFFYFLTSQSNGRAFY